MEQEEATHATPKQVEQAMRMAFYVAIVLLLIMLFMYIRSIGEDHEIGTLLVFLMMLVLVGLLGFLWRRAYWRMRRVALENGYD